MRIFTCLLAACLCLTCLTAQNTSTETMNHSSGDRTYIVHTPPAYDGVTPLPVVIVLHGLGDTADNMQNTGFSTLGDAEGFIAVYPQGLESILGSAWNNGTPLPFFDHDDVDFISQIINRMTGDYAADPSRIYVCGFSMGGIMSHRLACELSDKVTAIASMAGTMANSVMSSCAPGREVPVLHMHGDADETVPYGGNATLGLSSVEETIGTWVGVDNCPTTATTTALPDTAADGYTIDQDVYSPCGGDTEVRLYTIYGAPHTWLGGNNDIATTLEFWEFFKLHTNADATPTQETAASLSFSIQPNPSEGILNLTGVTEGMELRIVDAAGRVVWTSPAAERLDVSHLPKGCYFAHLLDPATGGQAVRKLMKI